MNFTEKHVFGEMVTLREGDLQEPPPALRFTRVLGPGGERTSISPNGVIFKEFTVFHGIWHILGEVGENHNVLVKRMPLLARGENPSKT